MSENIVMDIQFIINEFDEDYLVATLKLFLEETYPDNLNKMEDGYSTRDLKKIKIAAHTVKSSSGYLACNYFSKQCEKMEAYAKNGSWEDVDNFWKEFRTNYELLFLYAKKINDEYSKKREDENNLSNLLDEEMNKAENELESNFLF